MRTRLTLSTGRATTDSTSSAAPQLHIHRETRPTRDGPCSLLYCARDPIPEVPVAETSEPAASAIARCKQFADRHALVMVLLNPATAVGLDRIHLVAGIRHISIATSADRSCWDRLLSLGAPVFGVTETCSFAADRHDADDLLTALRYGDFIAEEGLAIERFDDDDAGARWSFASGAVTARIIIRDGFEAAVCEDNPGSWRDQGGEGVVRIAFDSSTGHCWSQPRFVGNPGRRT